MKGYNHRILKLSKMYFMDQNKNVPKLTINNKDLVNNIKRD